MLCQLLQVEEAEELSVVQNSLTLLLELDPRVCLKTVLGEHTRENPALRKSTLKYLAGESGPELYRVIRAKIESDHLLEADFAGWCADMLYSIQPPPPEAEKDEEMQTDEDHVAIPSKYRNFAAILPDLRYMQKLIAQLPTIWLPAYDFTSNADYLRAHRASRGLMDALALKSLEKMSALLRSQYDYLLFSEEMKEHVGDEVYEKEALDAKLEIRFFEDAAEEALTKLNASLADDHDGENRAVGARAQGGMDVDKTQQQDTPNEAFFLEKSYQNLLNWVSLEEPEWSAEAAQPVYDIQATYEIFRSRLLGFSSSQQAAQKQQKDLKDPLTLSTLSFFSPSIRSTLIRCGGITALSRRREAAAHGSAKACDTSMSNSLVAALLSVIKAPSSEADVVSPGVGKLKDAELVECAEAVFWGLTMSLPLVSSILFSEFCLCLC